MNRVTDRRVLIAALLLGLGLRLTILSQTPALGLKIADERQYTQLAASILHGRGFAWASGEPTSLRPPLYPAVVAGIWWLAGEWNLQAVRFAQVLMAAMTSVLLYELGRRAFDTRAGAMAAAVTWLYPSLIFANVTILTETLFIMLFVAFVLLSVMVIQTRSMWAAVGCGAALGLSALTRSVLWPLPLVLCPLLALLLPSGRARVALPVLVLAGYVMVIAPWAVRNTRLQGVFTVVDTMGGLNMRMGNYEYTPEDRMWDAVSMQGKQSWVYAFTQEPHPEPVTEGVKDKWAQRKAIQYVLANPLTTMRRDLIKFGDFWGLEREFIAGVQQRLYSPPTWFVLVSATAITLGYVALVFSAIAGIWLAAPAWRVHLLLLLPVVAITAVHTLVFGHSRYHLPLVPILALYAASASTRFDWPSWRRHPAALVGAALTLSILLAAWSREVLVIDSTRIRAFFE